jgi:hypothetical protein
VEGGGGFVDGVGMLGGGRFGIKGLVDWGGEAVDWVRLVEDRFSGVPAARTPSLAVSYPLLSLFGVGGGLWFLFLFLGSGDHIYLFGLYPWARLGHRLEPPLQTSDDRFLDGMGVGSRGWMGLVLGTEASSTFGPALRERAVGTRRGNQNRGEDCHANI